MPEYRFFYLKKDGHVAGTPATYDLPNDGVAIEQARLLLNGRDIEIWEGARVVSYIIGDKYQ
jgi:hypothetical protein